MCGADIPVRVCLPDRALSQAKTKNKTPRAGMPAPHKPAHIVSTHNHRYSSGLRASPRLTGFCRMYSIFSSRISSERITWSNDSSCHTGPELLRIRLTSRAEDPLILFKMSASQYTFPISFRSGVRSKCTCSGMTTAACNRNLIPFPYKHRSSTAVRQASESGSRVLFRKVTKIVASAFWRCGSLLRYR